MPLGGGHTASKPAGPELGQKALKGQTPVITDVGVLVKQDHDESQQV